MTNLLYHETVEVRGIKSLLVGCQTFYNHESKKMWVFEKSKYERCYEPVYHERVDVRGGVTHLL